MRIGIFIQSSNQELFMNNTRALLESYKRTISKLGLDMDVYAFTSGGANFGRTLRHGDTIYVPCNDKDVSKKTIECMRYIRRELPKYDVIMKTNNSTVVNIKSIYDFCVSSEYSDGIVYCCDAVRRNTLYEEKSGLPFFKGGFCSFPKGNFVMFSYSIFETLCDNFDKAFNYLKETFMPYNEDKCGGNAGCGVPEDAVFGYVLHYFGIEYTWLRNYVQMYDDDEFESIGFDCLENPFELTAISCKLSNDYKARLLYETKLIELICKFYEYGIEKY